MDNGIVTLSVSISDELHLQTENGQVVVSSRYVAERFNKRHGDVVRAIENKLELFQENDSTQNCVQYFIPSSYIDASGKNNKEYLLTRKGFSFIVMGFTGLEADKWKLAYIEAFDKMEATLKSNMLQGLSTEMQALLMHDKKIVEVENRLEHLEDNIHITRSQQKEIKQKVHKIAVKTLGGKNTIAYKEFSKKAFSEIYNWIYNAFNVPSYTDIAKKDYGSAINCLENWEPSKELRMIIIGANSQMKL